MIDRIDQIATSWWFGHTVILALCCAVVGAAMLLAPSPDAVSLFGVELPAMCTFRRATGIGCPGCGLTRSFAFMGQGSVWSAFQMNWLGPLLFTGVVAQLPYRVLRLSRAARALAPQQP